LMRVIWRVSLDHPVTDHDGPGVLHGVYAGAWRGVWRLDTGALLHTCGCDAGCSVRRRKAKTHGLEPDIALCMSKMRGVCTVTHDSHYGEEVLRLC
jgi:hypothetical protein